MMNYKKLYCLLLAFFFIQNLSCSQDEMDLRGCKKLQKFNNKKKLSFYKIQQKINNPTILNYLNSLSDEHSFAYREVERLIDLSQLLCIYDEATKIFQKQNPKEHDIIQGIHKLYKCPQWHIIETMNISKNKKFYIFVEEKNYSSFNMEKP